MGSNSFKRVVSTVIAVMFIAAMGVTIAVQPLLAQSSTPEDSMRTAEQLYARGEYELAAQSYQQLVDQGYADSTLYYNMAQAHMQNGELGRALWSLRSAQALDPRDPEVDAALTMVQEQLAGTNAYVPTEDPVERATELSASLFSVDDLAIIALLLWFLFAGLILLFVVRIPNRTLKRFARITTPIVGVLLIVAVLALGGRMRLYNDAAEAIVIASEVEISNGPGPEFGVQFALSEGSEVDIVETRGDWVRIVESVNGATGWAPANAVATVQPTGRG